MSSKSPIQWTDATWNPTTGCTRVSAGCDHCYAFQLHDQRHIAWKRGRFPGAPAQYHKPFSQMQLLPERLDDPLHWRKPRRVFVNSMSDLFQDAVDEDVIAAVWSVMQEAHWHTFQILTKRPERMVEIVPRLPLLPNVWLGTSVENSDYAYRIGVLRRVPAAVRFVSFEPLLGPISGVSLRGIHWVIVGGESGPGARLMARDWVDALRVTSRRQGVAFFFKQWGGTRKKTTGRMLNGRTWDEYPDVRMRRRAS